MKRADPSEVDFSDGSLPSESHAAGGPSHLPWFGAMTGLIAGGAFGAACCLLVEALGHIPAVAAFSAALGLTGGIAIESWQTKRVPGASADTGTYICTLYACIPAALVLLAGLGAVRGKLTGIMMLGAMFAFPAAGALAGAVLDRLREGARRRLSH